MAESDMRERVESLVADIPPGRVMTYGDIAAWCGYPGAARRVGAVAAGGTPGLPWHRVVRSGGHLAVTSNSDTHWQEDALEAEGIALKGGHIVAFNQLRWEPGQVL